MAVEHPHSEKLDVKTTFAHGDAEENINTYQPKENQICRLDFIIWF